MNSDNSEKWISKRFERPVKLTFHARERMKERKINQELLGDLIETGTATYKDERRLWLSKAYTNRDDNLICAAVVLEDNLVVKTVMHRWELKEDYR